MNRLMEVPIRTPRSVSSSLPGRVSRIAKTARKRLTPSTQAFVMAGRAYG